MRNQQLKFLILDSLFAIIIAILAQVAIPIGPIPFTGQTFAIGLAATILGAKHGTISVFVYIMLGIIGIPVFQGMTAGIGILIGITGGYIIGFLANTFITGYILDKTRYTTGIAITANIIGALFTLLFGMIWLKIGAGMSLTKSFYIGFLPFLIPGIIKAALAGIFGIMIRNRLVKSRLLSEKKL
ncbi:BioY family protein [Listeria floridensis FSL S10-1187]|uniref:Biotin transporter n=1 Tax=Listeria floridensis FSL S10-1187 TaxID=1265817 RepID=A0ABN0RI21_9LIST|nr:BioY family transporter [Listeria floridensis]EUJ33660.1 BioY family protein [Listeria floridensis FSL S10-1187]